MSTLDMFFTLDLPVLLAAGLCAVPCALTGSFLVLRRQAMMGDALSHAVLPGLVLGFMLAGGVSAFAMAAGALLSCLAAVGLIAAVQSLKGIDPGTAMGIVFTALFALGVVMLETGLGTRVHLDTQHALFGALELMRWDSPNLSALAGISLFASAAAIVLYRILAVTSFDPVFARSIGMSTALVHIVLMGLAALTAVAAFQAVGSILVIALFACPPACARLLTDRLDRQLLWSALIALATAWGGYALAAGLPPLFGSPMALNAAGTIAVMNGAALAACALKTVGKQAKSPVSPDKA